MNLILVESPTKAKLFKNFIRDYEVIATKGHMFDLEKPSWDAKELGIDQSKWEPLIKLINKKETIKLFNQISKIANKANKIIFATDNDREGEAISYYLAKALNVDANIKNRAVFNEINEKTFTESLANLQLIDVSIVNAQKTRRMIDRIVGIKLSKFLRQSFNINNISAGRVQSVALLLICDRINEIKKFIPIKFYKIFAYYKNYEFAYSFLENKNSWDNLLDAKKALKLTTNKNEFKIINIINKKTIGKKILPFITSSLLRNAYSILGFSTRKTMMVAQNLYEGKDVDPKIIKSGLITYMRTDSRSFSNSFIVQAKTFIDTNYSDLWDYNSQKNNKNIKFSQNAHECIRPVDLNINLQLIEKQLKKDEFLLYKLIYNRTLQSLTKSSIMKNTTYYCENDNKQVFKILNKKYDFIGNNQFSQRDYKKNEMNTDLILNKNDIINFDAIELKDYDTKPLPYYNQGSLITKLEDLGIARPSTYGTIIPTLIKRKYIEIKNKQIISTIRGNETNNLLQKYFDKIINSEFTSNMENKLDLISEDELNYHTVTEKYFENFMDSYKIAETNSSKNIQIKINEKCPKCGNGDLILKYNKKNKSDFIGCSNYYTDTKCCYSRPYEVNSDNFASQKTELLCEKCKNLMVTRKNRKRNNIFIACSNFPKCKNILPSSSEIEKIIKNLSTVK